MTEPVVAVTFENTGPPPHASGEDWAAYFRAYREGLEAKAAEKAEKARLTAENGKSWISVPNRFVDLEELTGGAATFAKMIAKAKPDWQVVGQFSITHHEPTLYTDDAKSKNENDEKGHVAGDVRYPEHDELHQAVEVAAILKGKMLLYVWVNWTQKISAEGDEGPVTWKYAKTYVQGMGWSFYLKATDFTEWLYAIGLKPRPKPKKKPAEPAPENGEWHG